MSFLPMRVLANLMRVYFLSVRVIIADLIGVYFLVIIADLMGVRFHTLRVLADMMRVLANLLVFFFEPVTWNVYHDLNIAGKCRSIHVLS